MIRIREAYGGAKETMSATRVRQQILDDPDCRDPYRLVGVTITGSLDLNHVHSTRVVIFDKCVFRNPVSLEHARFDYLSFRACAVPGLSGQHLRVEGDMTMTGSTIRGSVDLTGAHITDDLHLENATFGSRLDGVALSCEGATIGGRVCATGLRCTGGVNFINVESGPFELIEAALENGDYALHVDRLRIKGSMYFDRSSILGGVHAIGMVVGGSVYFEASHLSTPVRQLVAETPDALLLDRSTVDGDIQFTGNFRATGKISIDDVSAGRVKLRDVNINSGVNGDGLALTGERAIFRDGLSITGKVQINGVVQMSRAQVGGDFVFLRSIDDRAAVSPVDISGAQIGNDLRVVTNGTVGLGRARVGGVVRVALGALRSADSNAAAADLHALATPLLEITGRPATGYLDLTRAKIGVLQDEPDGWGAGELVLNGLEYEDLHRSGVPVDVRIEWLKSGTSRLRGPAEEQRTASYVPQPYEQLAATYRRTGNDQDARTVLLHKWRARNRAIPWRQWYRKLWNYTQDLAIGYGYAPWRALSVMLIVLVLAIVLFRLNGTVPNEESSLFETIVFAFVLAVPGFGLRSGFWPDSANLSDQITMLALSFFGLTLGAAIISAVIRTMRRE